MANAARHGSRSAFPILESISLTIAAFIVSLVAGVAFIVPMFVLGYDLEATAVLLGATAVGQVAFLVVGYAYVRVRDVPVPVDVPSRSDVLAVLGGTTVALVLATGLSALLLVLDLLPESVIGEIAVSDPVFLLGLAALSVVIVAPAEELLFRGAIQGRLRDRFGPVPAILGSSLLFGSLHLANYTGSFRRVFAGALLIVVVGTVFGTVYEYTGNLAVPIVTHATYNVVLLVIAYLTI